MRFVNKLSYSWARSLSNNLNETHQKRAVFYYGLIILNTALIKIIVTLGIAALLGVIVPTIIITLVFGSLRMLAGGYHMDTYGKCLLASLIQFQTAALITQYSYIYWNLLMTSTLVLATFVLSYILIYKYAPKDTPNKPITDPKEISKFKKLSSIYLTSLLLIVFVLLFLGQFYFVIPICFSILLEIFTITPAGHVFYEAIRVGLNNHKKTVKNI